jgi:hypothetical protein
MLKILEYIAAVVFSSFHFVFPKYGPVLLVQHKKFRNTQSYY